MRHLDAVGRGRREQRAGAEDPERVDARRIAQRLCLRPDRNRIAVDLESHARRPCEFEQASREAALGRVVHRRRVLPDDPCVGNDADLLEERFSTLAGRIVDVEFVAEIRREDGRPFDSGSLGDENRITGFGPPVGTYVRVAPIAVSETSGRSSWSTYSE